MKETDRGTVLYNRLDKALQQAAISEVQRLGNKSHGEMKTACPLNRLSLIAALELWEYMDRLMDTLHIEQCNTNRSFVGAAEIVKGLQCAITGQLSEHDFKKSLEIYESIIDCCDEFSGVNILASSRLVENLPR
jgi:hypothetical protein